MISNKDRKHVATFFARLSVYGGLKPYISYPCFVVIAFSLNILLVLLFGPWSEGSCEMRSVRPFVRPSIRPSDSVNFLGIGS